jgi:hypothetical protein
LNDGTIIMILLHIVFIFLKEGISVSTDDVTQQRFYTGSRIVLVYVKLNTVIF